jgi:hypothetical protein
MSPAATAGEMRMTSENPVHDLQKALAAARLRAVEELAANGETFSPDDLQKLAILQGALSAVNELIAEHQGRLGWGPAAPLE